MYFEFDSYNGNPSHRFLLQKACKQLSCFAGQIWKSDSNIINLFMPWESGKQLVTPVPVVWYLVSEFRGKRRDLCPGATVSMHGVTRLVVACPSFCIFFCCWAEITWWKEQSRFSFSAFFFLLCWICKSFSTTHPLVFKIVNLINIISY